MLGDRASVCGGRCQSTKDEHQERSAPVTEELLNNLESLTRALTYSRGRVVRAMLHGRREFLSAQRMTISGEGWFPCSRISCLHDILSAHIPHTVTLSSLILSRCRSIVERLSVPGVRRLFVVDPDTRRMEGIVSLSDVAAYLFDVF